MATIDILSLKEIPARQHIRVSKVVVHENFSSSMNDIALLKLGEESHDFVGNLHLAVLDKLKMRGKVAVGYLLAFVCNLIHISYSEDRADLSVFSPVCLPSSANASMVGEKGHVYGRL